MTEQTMRCFIGVPVDHHVALALLELRDQALSAFGQPQIRPVPARNFHLTLAFLGNLASAQRVALATPLAQLARSQPSFLQPLDMAQVFPSPQGRLWAAEGLQVPVPMRQLHGALTGLLGRLGLPVGGQALRPHVTLLRGLHTCLRPPKYPLTLAVPVSSLVLYESRPVAGGSEYRVLESAALAG